MVNLQSRAEVFRPGGGDGCFLMSSEGNSGRYAVGKCPGTGIQPIQGGCSNCPLIWNIFNLFCSQIFQCKF